MNKTHYAIVGFWLALSTLFSMANGTGCVQKDNKIYTGVVVSTDAVLYADESGKRAERIISRLNIGASFLVLRGTTDWAQIDLLNNKIGWIEKRHFEIRFPDTLTLVSHRKDTPIYSQMTDSSRIVDTLISGESVIAEDVIFSTDEASGYWVKIRPLRMVGSRHGFDRWGHLDWGWIKMNDVDVVQIEILRDAAHHFAGWVGDICWRSSKDLDKALVFFSLLSEKYANTEFYSHEMFTIVEKHYGAVVGLMGSARIYTGKKDYEKAMRNLQIVAEKYPHAIESNAVSGISAYCEMARIYAYILNDKEKASEMYHNVIKKFPDSPDGGKYGGSTDLSAVYLLFDLWKNDEKRLIKECNIVLSETPSIKAHSYAYLTIVKTYSELGEIEQGIDKLTEFLKVLPSSGPSRNPYNDSMTALGVFVDNVFIKTQSSEKASLLCEKIQSSLSDRNLKAFLEYKIVQAKDYGSEDVEPLIEAYSKIKKDYGDVTFQLPDWRMNMPVEDAWLPHNIDKRLQALSTAKQTKGKILADNTALYRRLSSDSLKIRQLNKDTAVLVLYQGGTRTKVKTEKGEIGWVENTKIFSAK